LIVQAFQSSAGRGFLASLKTRLTVRTLLAVALTLLALLHADDAAAQCGGGGPRIGPPPGPCPTVNIAGTGNAHQSGHAATLDVGTHFLQRLTALSSFRTAASAANNPQGGGAEGDTDRYRTWLEGYLTRATFDAQNTFPGDRRKTVGGVAGFGVTVVPDFNVGVSVDQSQTRIGIASGDQSGRIDLTQIGALASLDRGPWNLSTTLVHGFGDVHSSRVDGGLSTADYGARLWGAMAELSYYWTLPGNARVVPKLTADWLHTRTDAFVESGGASPVSGSAVTTTRVRMMAGAELGKSWLVDRRILDASVYARLVDNLVQDVSSLSIALADGTGSSLAVTGIRESRLGADAGAALSARVTDMMRLYLVYDGRYRSNFISHGGIVGAEFRF
jgi:uncharacterized protein with beta-barrel porin domain